jgi:hypothetical protein
MNMRPLWIVKTNLAERAAGKKQIPSYESITRQIQELGEAAMPSAVITKFNPPRRPRKRHPIVDEMKHALTQQYLEKQYPGRKQSYPDEELPRSEWP